MVKGRNAKNDGLACVQRVILNSSTSSLPTSLGGRVLWILMLLVMASCTKSHEQQLQRTVNRDSIAEMRADSNRELNSAMSSTPHILQKNASPDSVLRKNSVMSVDTLVGVVYVSGNEPFTRLTLALKDWRSSVFVEADSNLSKQLWKLQGRVVKILGKVVKSRTGDYIHVREFTVIR